MLPQLLANSRTMDGAADEDARIYSSGRGDSRGYFRDGTYVAAPLHAHQQQKGRDAAQSLGDSSSALVRPQQAAMDAILARYDKLRSLIAKAPANRRLPASFHSNGKTSTSSTPPFLLHPPAPTILRTLNPPTVLSYLTTLTPYLTNESLFSSHSTDRVDVLGPWILGLLARVPNVEEMFSEDLSIVRELAKRAASVVRNDGSIDELEQAPGLGRKTAGQVLENWRRQTQGVSEVAQAKESKTAGNEVQDQGTGREEEDRRVLEIARQQVLSSIGLDEDEAVDAEGDQQVENLNDEVGKKSANAVAQSPDTLVQETTERDPVTQVSNPIKPQYRKTHNRANKDSGRRRRNTSSPLSSARTSPAPERQSNSIVKPIPDSHIKDADDQIQSYPLDFSNNDNDNDNDNHPNNDSTELADADEGEEEDRVFPALTLLDTIISIVSIRYRQRDLLPVRERIWINFGGGS